MIMNSAKCDDGHDDAELLGPLVVGRVKIGVVEEVNGAGAEVVSGYHLTRAELQVLARHWYEEKLESEIFCFLHDCSGSREIRIMPYASMRIARIEGIIGESAVSEAIDRVDAEARERLGEETWRILTKGDRTERSRLQDETERAVKYLTTKLADEPTCRAAHAFLSTHPTEIYFDPAGDMWHLAESLQGQVTTPGQLVLKVTTRKHGTACAGTYGIDRP